MAGYNNDFAREYLELKQVSEKHPWHDDNIGTCRENVCKTYPTSFASANPNNNFTRKVFAKRRGFKTGWGSGEVKLNEYIRYTMPGAFKEHEFDMGHMNKIFVSQWLNDSEVVFGTKCNKLVILNTNTGAMRNITTLMSSRPAVNNVAGIHAMQINQSRTYLATGAHSVCDAAIYKLPEFKPICVAEKAHDDWIFDVAWLDDFHFATGSRDGKIGLFTVPTEELPAVPRPKHRARKRPCYLLPDVPPPATRSRTIEHVAETLQIQRDNLREDFPRRRFCNRNLLIRMPSLRDQYYRSTSPHSNHTLSLSDHLPSPSNHTPALSNHAASHSNHVPASSNEAPSHSNYAPASSNHAPPHSNHARASSNHAPSRSNHVPASSNHAPSHSNYAPASSNHAPSHSNQTPASSNHAPSHSNYGPTNDPLEGMEGGDSELVQLYSHEKPQLVKKLRSPGEDRVRCLAVDTTSDKLFALTTKGKIYRFDMETMIEVGEYEQKFTGENVCMCASKDSSQIAVGSKSHVTLYDTRTMKERAYVETPITNCGVRSITFEDPVMTVGTGAGCIVFFDLRTMSYIQCACNVNRVIFSSDGYLQRDRYYMEMYMNDDIMPHAIYTLQYDQTGTRLFSAGGPLPAGLTGNYAAIWQ